MYKTIDGKIVRAKSFQGLMKGENTLEVHPKQAMLSEVEQLISDNAIEITQAMIDISLNPETKESVRISAGNSLLDRLFGKASSNDRLQITGADNGPITFSWLPPNSLDPVIPFNGETLSLNDNVPSDLMVDSIPLNDTEEV
jgi:hypothetical protein